MDIVSYGRGRSAQLPLPPTGVRRRPLRGQPASPDPKPAPLPAAAVASSTPPSPPRPTIDALAPSMPPRPRQAAVRDGRVDWVDIAKGICIVLVVTMHTTLGVEAEMDRAGFMHAAVAFAKPFRMPDFFLVSGLFLSRVIDRDWRSFADRRVLHFAYFYILWLVIQSLFKVGQVSGGSLQGFLRHLAESLIEPYSMLWFIYVLAVFSVATKLLRRVPPVVLFAAAAALQVMPIETGLLLVDEFCERWVFFLAGYLLADRIFQLAESARTRPVLSVLGLAAWAIVNGALSLTSVDFVRRTMVTDLPVIGLAAGFAGALAIICAAALLSRLSLSAPLRYAGENSIVIYLTFFLPMAVGRTVLVRTGLLDDPGTVALLVTGFGVAVPLLVERLVRDTRFAFLYRRPAWAHIPPPRPPRPAMHLQPAE